MPKHSQERRNQRAQALGFANDYERRLASGQGRGFHPKEFGAALRSPTTAAVVPDVTRNDAGQVTRLRFVVTDAKGKQRTFDIRKPTDAQIARVTKIVDASGAPYLPGYEGKKKIGANTKAGRSRARRARGKKR